MTAANGEPPAEVWAAPGRLPFTDPYGARGVSWYVADAGSAGCRESYGGRVKSYCLIVLPENKGGMGLH